jgi:hypothetical protein
MALTSLLRDDDSLTSTPLRPALRTKLALPMKALFQLFKQTMKRKIDFSNVHFGVQLKK